MAYGTVTADLGAGGATFAQDTIAGAVFPRTKISIGAEGAATDVADASGARMPVHIAQSSVTVGVSIGAELPAGTNNIGDVDVVSVQPGNGPINLGKSEDAAHATGDIGVMALAVRDDVLGAFSGADGDYEPLHTTAAGRLYTSATVDAAIPAGTNNIGDVDVLTLPALPAGTNNIGDVDVLTLPSLPTGTNNIGDVDVLTLPALPVGNNNIGDVDIASFAAGALVEVQGDAAHDAVVAGNPVLNGFEARNANPTAVANGDAVRGIADLEGRQVVSIGAIPQTKVTGNATFTNTTAADVIAAGGAGIKTVVTSILVVNGHATVGTKVEIRDGTTVKMQPFCASAGGGFSLSDPSGIFVSTANTAVTARNVTTGADVDVFISGYRTAA